MLGLFYSAFMLYNQNNMKKFCVLCLIIILIFPCCSKKSEIHAAEEATVYKMVSMKEGLEITKSNDCVIVDVRRLDEYESGHIPGAVLLTLETISPETAAKVLPDKDQMILIYCRSGRRSKIAAQSLIEIGYTNVIEFGGILDYTGELEK